MNRLTAREILTVLERKPGYISLRPDGTRWMLYDHQTHTVLARGISEKTSYEVHYHNTNANIIFTQGSYWASN